MTTTDMDGEIHRFLTFMEKFGSESMTYRDGLLFSPGCDGDPGGCCARTYDLDGLADILRDLIGGNHG